MIVNNFTNIDKNEQSPLTFTHWTHNTPWHDKDHSIWQTLHHKVIWFVREKQKINIWNPAATSVTLISLITIIIHSQATQWFVFRLSITNITTSLVTRLSHAYMRITTHNIINTYYFIPAIKTNDTYLI